MTWPKIHSSNLAVCQLNYVYIVEVPKRCIHKLFYWRRIIPNFIILPKTEIGRLLATKFCNTKVSPTFSRETFTRVFHKVIIVSMVWYGMHATEIMVASTTERKGLLVSMRSLH